MKESLRICETPSTWVIKRLLHNLFIKLLVYKIRLFLHRFSCSKAQVLKYASTRQRDTNNDTILLSQLLSVILTNSKFTKH